LNRYQYINQNIERIKREVRFGERPVSVLRHFEIYSRYDYYRKTGEKICDAVLFTGEDLTVNESWINKIRKSMEQEGYEVLNN
jgi:hypothetical protein